jgi:hypothetical protein
MISDLSLLSDVCHVRSTIITNVSDEMGKVDNIEYENIEKLTFKKWLKSGELETPNVETYNWL